MKTLDGQIVLITGGTMGIGLATGLAFGARGARTVLTYNWGSADLDEVRGKYEAAGAPAPLIVQADVSRPEDTERLLKTVAETHDRVDTFISNVAFALKTNGLDDYDERGLFRSISYSAWPLWAYTQKIEAQFGAYPSRIIGLSSDGPDAFFRNYDFVAISKSVLETMCRYMNVRLFEHGSRVNIVRSRLVRTESFDATFGKDFHAFLEEMGGFEDCYTSPEEIADVVLALGGGLMDAVGGQVIMADRGFSFFDNLNGIYERRLRKSAEMDNYVSSK